jgi:hypothetical protein
MQLLDGKKPAVTSASSGANQGTVWQFVEGTLKPLAVTTGATDGMVTEVAGGALVEGAQVVTRAAVASPTPSTARPGSSSNPLMGSQPRR